MKNMGKWELAYLVFYIIMYEYANHLFGKIIKNNFSVNYYGVNCNLNTFKDP